MVRHEKSSGIVWDREGREEINLGLRKYLHHFLDWKPNGILPGYCVNV